jgi:predicted RNase H-like HicB family nuclease
MIEYKAAFYEGQENGWFLAKVLDFPGVATPGRTLDKAREMLRDDLREMSEWLLEDGQPLPHPDPAVSDPNADVIEPIQLSLSA